MANPKISVYSLPDLKNTTDDALPNFLTSLKFKQSHFYADVRLALGYAAVVIAAATFYFDYYYDWSVTKEGTFWAVGVYFILNSALTFWMWFVEKGTIFQGTRNGETIRIATSVQKHVPVYQVEVHCEGVNKDSPGKNSHMQLKAPFAKWFTSEGEFVATEFQSWLASEVPLVKKAMESKKQ